jgi:hypothetical protein
VLAIEGQIKQGLKRVEGYQQTAGTADFSFVLQPAATSAGQISAGNPYRKEMLQQAGLPAVEAGSRHQRRYGEFQGGPATFTAETHVEIAGNARVTPTQGASI